MGEKLQNHQCATSVCSTEEFPMEWKRRQFPVRTSFAMTINKSQGQSLERVVCSILMSIKCDFNISAPRSGASQLVSIYDNSLFYEAE